MAINRGNVYQLNLPEQPSFQQGGMAQQRPQGISGIAPDKLNEYLGIPKALDGLQYTEEVANISKDYYTKRAELESFAKTQALRNKIDVTSPDPNDPASIAANQIWLAGLADLQYTGDLLQQSQKQFIEAKKLSDQGKFIFNEGAFNQPMALMSPEQIGYTTEVDPRLKFAGEQLGKTFSAGEFQQAQQNLQGGQQMFANQATPSSRFSQDTAALSQAITPNKQVFAPRDGDGGFGETDPNAQFVKKYAYLALGHPSVYKPSGSFKEGTNTEYGISYEDVGTQMGVGAYKDEVSGKTRQEPFIIAYYMYDPDTDQAFAVPQNPAMQPKPLNKNRLVSFVGEIADSNKGGVVTGSSLRKYLSENAKTNNLKDYDAEFFLDLKEQEKARGFVGERKAVAATKAAERKAIEDQLAGEGIGRGGTFGTGRLIKGRFVDTAGNEIRVKENRLDSNLTIDEWQDIIPGNLLTSDGGVQIGQLKLTKKKLNDGLTPVEMRKLLEALGARVVGTNIAQPNTQISQPEIDPDI